MSNTIQQLYQGEVRTIQLTLYDRNNTSNFAPSGAFYSVIDSDGDIVMEETEVTAINENIINGIINTTVTDNVGTYFIIWKIMKSGSIYLHKTRLDVITLLPNL